VGSRNGWCVVCTYFHYGVIRVVVAGGAVVGQAFGTII
jgi:hypothetical protein